MSTHQFTVTIIVIMFSALLLVVAVLAVEGYRFLRGEPSVVTEMVADHMSQEVSSTGPSSFVHESTSDNISGNSTYLDHPSANDNPAAILHVTPNWNPGGEAGVYNNHPIGVWYDPNRRRWAIFNQDRAAMPEGVRFNVTVMDDPREQGSSATSKASELVLSLISGYV